MLSFRITISREDGENVWVRVDEFKEGEFITLLGRQLAKVLVQCLYWSVKKQEGVIFTWR